MIFDVASLAVDRELTASICIVGAGAAGITLACELDGCGVDVLLLDSGHGQRGEPYEGAADAPHAPPALYRRLGFGGTTGLWGGRCVPYDPIDFERRDYVPDSGWPIPYAEVAAHYPAAMAYCDAGRNDFTASGSVRGARPQLPGVQHSALELDRLERYSLPTDFGRRHGRRLARSGNVRIVRDAHVLNLRKAAGGGRIEGLDFVDGAGRRRRCRADIVVLAMGGLETTRLLLASDPAGPGLGNRSGHLGRYYQCHVGGVLGVLRPRWPGTVFHFEKTLDGIYAKRKIQIAAAAQRRERLPNIAFRLHYPDMSDPSHGSAVLSSLYLFKHALPAEYRRILQHGSGEGVQAHISRHLRNLAFGLPAFLGFGLDWARRRVLAQRKLPYVLVANRDGSFPLDFNAEQMPLRDSRVELGPDRDRHGVPRLVVRWRKSDADVEAIWRAFHVLRDGLQSEGHCALEFESGKLRQALQEAGPVGGHHIGTARMAADAGAGVVDSDCALFELPNLHLASAAVFPTSSHANPTLTIVAMAIRLAAHLRRGAAGRPA